MRTIAIFLMSLFLVAPAAGHHSDAGIDMDSTVKFEGTVTEFNWRNPHIYFAVETTSESGETVEWELQMGSTPTVARIGWSPDTLKPGDRVAVSAHPARSGRRYGILEGLVKDGVAVPVSFIRPSGEQITALAAPTVRATSLEGLWMADTSKLVSYPGGLDGFFDALLVPTAKGAAARAAYDPLSPENPEAQCIGRPTPGLIMSSNLFPIQIEFNDAERIIKIKTEYWDEERTVYMDGRGHPQDGVRALHGHSIGRWDGDTLVVDTRNFADHRSPYQIGVPSGAQKHVVERYRLLEGGSRAVVEFMLEDPEYMAQPITHERELVYKPELEPAPFNCDPESTRRFLPE